MNKIFTLIITILSITGCGKTFTIPIDQNLLSEEMATVIIFNVSGYDMPPPLEVLVDNKVVGLIKPEAPLKIEVNAGNHDFYVRRPKGSLVIQRKTSKFFNFGKVYYMKVWLERGVFVSSLRIDSANPITHYNTFIHN